MPIARPCFGNWRPLAPPARSDVPLVHWPLALLAILAIVAALIFSWWMFGGGAAAWIASRIEPDERPPAPKPLPRITFEEPDDD